MILPNSFKEVLAYLHQLLSMHLHITHLGPLNTCYSSTLNTYWHLKSKSWFFLNLLSKLLIIYIIHQLYFFLILSRKSLLIYISFNICYNSTLYIVTFKRNHYSSYFFSSTPLCLCWSCVCITSGKDMEHPQQIWSKFVAWLWFCNSSDIGSCARVLWATVSKFNWQFGTLSSTIHLKAVPFFFIPLG